VIESSACSAGHVAYVHNRAYLLPSSLADYLVALTDPSATALAPDVLGSTLPEAAATARREGDTLEVGGELIYESAAGTVLLQYPTADHQLEVIVAVHRSPRCRADQLDVQYLPGSAGAGNDFGTVLLRNVSGSWCELSGPATITGLTSGRPLTRTVRLTVVRDLELSPAAAGAVPGRALPADQLAASISLIAEYRDDQDGSSCTPMWVVPKTWRVALDSQALTVANGRATADATPPGTGGLITCRGRFGASSVQTATS
jgi:hypothetical protein